MKRIYGLFYLMLLCSCSFASPKQETTAASVMGVHAESDVLLIKQQYVSDSRNNTVGYSSIPDYYGLNKVVLGKNIIGGVNCLSQAMLSDANTIYVIQYDYLLSEDVIVPENCVLQFDGGSIRGAHSIQGKDTRIEAGLFQIFGINTIFDGTWNVNELNIKWFGAKGDNKTNDTQAFKNCIESPAVANRVYKVLINQGHLFNR